MQQLMRLTEALADRRNKTIELLTCHNPPQVTFLTCSHLSHRDSFKSIVTRYRQQQGCNAGVGCTEPVGKWDTPEMSDPAPAPTRA